MINWRRALAVLMPLGLIGAGLWVQVSPAWSMVTVGGLLWLDLQVALRRERTTL